MTYRTIVLFAAAALGAGACYTVASTPAGGATAVMRDASGQSLGALRLEQTATGVRVSGDLAGIPAGMHGIHFHQVGRCDGSDFASAGGHFNPAQRKHGLENPAGPHAGDLPNVVVPSSGRVSVELLTPRITLDGATSTGVFDADGTALVLHAAADDQRTDPSGNSGARIACAVIGGT